MLLKAQCCHQGNGGSIDEGKGGNGGNVGGSDGV